MRTETQAAADTTAQGAVPLWAWLTATFFGVGKVGPGPGTWASAAAALIWVAVAQFTSQNLHNIVLILMTILAVSCGIPAATRVARASRQKDPGFVVIDEVAGQWITLLFAPITWKSMLVGFILFRGFDIVKPPPVRQLERLPEGTGIVVDDIAAGIYALVVMQVLLRFGFLSR